MAPTVRAPDDVPCGWAPISDPLYRRYHDLEWGVPERDPREVQRP